MFFRSGDLTPSIKSVQKGERKKVSMSFHGGHSKVGKNEFAKNCKISP